MEVRYQQAAGLVHINDFEYSSIFTFLNAYCSSFPVFLKPPVGGEPGEVPSIAACSFNSYSSSSSSSSSSSPNLIAF